MNVALAEVFAEEIQSLQDKVAELESKLADTSGRFKVAYDSSTRRLAMLEKAEQERDKYKEALGFYADKDE
jgi:hypothetical protein